MIQFPMFEILLSIFAGILQGVTEFLPISSSGHLILFHEYFKINFPDTLAFDVVLHLGTLIALLLYFFDDVKKYLVAWFQSIVKPDLKNNKEQLLAWYLFLATLPAAIIGFYFEQIVEVYLRNSIIVAIMLIAFGILLYLADTFFQKSKKITELSLRGALIIGLAQALALIPGVSRSGITIIAGLSQKLQREQAAKFSFLLSIPIVFGAGLKKLLDLQQIDANQVFILVIGFTASAVVGYFVIKYFLKFLQSHSLKIFAYYRIALGLVILTALLFNF